MVSIARNLNIGKVRKNEECRGNNIPETPNGFLITKVKQITTYRKYFPKTPRWCIFFWDTQSYMKITRKPTYKIVINAVQTIYLFQVYRFHQNKWSRWSFEFVIKSNLRPDRFFRWYICRISSLESACAAYIQMNSKSVLDTGSATFILLLCESNY